MKLLIIEDSINLLNTLATGFRGLGYTVDKSCNAEEGLQYALINDYDAIILDLMLPTVGGLNILKELRDKKNLTHVITLSTKDNIEDRISGLYLGADDYLIKPFSFDELHTRLLTLTRLKHGFKSPLIYLGNVSIDIILKKVSISGIELKFTPIEYRIIELLVLNINQVVPYDSLLSTIHSDNIPSTRNTLEVHISAIRNKLKKNRIINLIQTKRSFGYFIEKT